MRALLVTAALGLAVAACGAQEEAATQAAPATLPAAALPELASTARTLDAEALAADALEPERLAALLRDSGFESGREREFSGKTKTWDRVVARALRFRSAEGAEAYLDWLGAHGNDLLGRAVPAKMAPPGESGVAFVLARCGTCKKELPTFLSGWRRDELVLFLLAAGSGGNPERFGELVRDLDETGRRA
ncbi:MAG TPA: hypothetical protein VHF23_07565 [Gaiellaceae bacterium]|nr:hypothetical protein [Gaiellaceae bacterium]